MNHISGWLLALPFLAGAVLPLQAGINGQLARQLSSVFAAALISFASIQRRTATSECAGNAGSD